MARVQAVSIVSRIESKIYLLRRQKVMLSADLAALYEVAPRIMMQAVRRNTERFPADFMFRLTKRENAFLRSQSVILSGEWGKHSKYLPYAFTEQGVAMLSGVLNSRRAVLVNVEIMRAFVRMRRETHARNDMEKRLALVEKTLLEHDSGLRDLYQKIRPLLLPPPDPPRRRIGFGVR